MKVFLNQNVYDAALERIRYIFDEFPEVIVGMSGGKDSTVSFHLALQVAQEKNRLPIKVFFLDQEIEWNCVIDYIRTVMHRDDVDPIWLQMPFKINNAASTTENWLHCWHPDDQDKWIRPKEPISIHENHWGTPDMEFHDVFPAYMKKEYKGKKACFLAGMRAEESPTRAVTLTSKAKYKHITYAKRLNKPDEHYTFYPLYDWSYTDIWKAIHDHHWAYCSLYDAMYQYGVSIHNMRVSNLNHETAVRSLFYAQEIEGETWQKVQRRLGGVNTAKTLKEDGFEVKELPFMFKDWREYRDHLLENLITDKENQEKLRHHFERMDKKYKAPLIQETCWKQGVATILCNDFILTKMTNWERRPEVHSYRQFMKGQFHAKTAENKYVKDAIKHLPASELPKGFFDLGAN